jgi:hypothetical protein
MNPFGDKKKAVTLDPGLFSNQSNIKADIIPNTNREWHELLWLSFT